jgi:hypothetical protein
MMLNQSLGPDSLNESNSSSFSSLSQLTHQNQQSFQQLSISQNMVYVEEIVNFLDETSDQASNLLKKSIPCFLVTNVSFDKSDNFAYLITSDGDVYFFQMENFGEISSKNVIWHKSLNVFVMNYYKYDINVSCIFWSEYI